MPSKSSKLTFENKEVLKKVIDDAQESFDNYKMQREDFLEIWEVNDYMYRAGQNQTLNSDEKDKGANLGTYDDDTERANTGSTQFHRIVNSVASRSVAIQKSRPIPFKYKPVLNSNIFSSREEADDQAAQRNALARWTYKNDKLNVKSIEFWWALSKYGNIPVMVRMNKTKMKKMIPEPVYTVDEETGDVTTSDIKLVESEVTIKNYPTLDILPVDSLYADLMIGNIKDQNTVVVVSIVGKRDMWDGVRGDYYDEDQVKTVGATHEWDGETNKDLSQTRLDNQRVESPLAVSTAQYMKFDILTYQPINDDGELDVEETEPVLYWITVVGQSIQDGVPIRIDRMIDVDPDDEIPIEVIHDMPDDSDTLYHISRGQIVRSNYSVECTMKNQTVDNGAAVNRPPLLEREGAVRGAERGYVPGARWTTDIALEQAIKEFPITNTLQSNVAILDWITEDTRTALNLDKNDLGESFGARTSSNEASIINRSSNTPRLVTVNYAMDQLWTFYARKAASYWNAFSDPDQIVSITDDNVYSTVMPKGLYGEFDIEVDIVDEYEDDLTQSANLREFIRMIAENPVFAGSVDMPELLTEYAKKLKLDYSKFVRKPTDEDANARSNDENKALMGGDYIAPKEGENHAVHIRNHEGERLRYKGIEDQYPSVTLLDQHIDETKFMRDQAAEQQASPITGAEAPLTEGQQAGGEIAAALGGEVPQ